MATTKFQSGGAFLPTEPLNLTGDASNFVNPPTIGGSATAPGTSVVVGTTDTQTLTNKTLTAPTITGGTVTTTGATLTAPVISGAATVASGATLTTPTVLLTAVNPTATGATGGAGAALTAVTPQLVAATGASGAGLDLPGGATGVVGSYYVIQNLGTGAINVYAVGGTINGTTGTTAYPITATGNRTAHAFCYAAGAWSIRGNT